MGWLQCQVIGEAVAPLAPLSGIALSPEDTVRYGRHRRKLSSRFGRPPWYFSLLGLLLLSLPAGLVL